MPASHLLFIVALPQRMLEQASEAAAAVAVIWSSDDEVFSPLDAKPPLSFLLAKKEKVAELKQHEHNLEAFI